MFFFFTDHEQVFFGQIPVYSAHLNLQFTIRCCMFSANVYGVYVHGKMCLQFTCIFCIFAVHGRSKISSRILEF